MNLGYSSDSRGPDRSLERQGPELAGLLVMLRISFGFSLKCDRKCLEVLLQGERCNLDSVFQT